MTVFTCSNAGRKFSLVLGLVAGLLAGTPAHAQFEASEYDLKAAFMHQFLAYVSWPEAKHGAPDEPLRIGVVGAPELADNLAMLSLTQQASTRHIHVSRMQPGDDPRDLHVLFVAAGLGGESGEMLRNAVAGSVLTITENTPRISDSIINLEIIDGKVRFDVALGLAQQNGLDISARLLQVALRVVDLP